DKKLLVRYDFIRHVQMGFNYRLNEISAAVALAQLEKLDCFVNWRIRCAEVFAETIKGVPFLQAQKVHENMINSYWAFAVKLTDDRIDWQEFYDKFCEFGGDGFYGAWRLSYDEPFFSGIIPAEHKICPNADMIQPRLMQFKTNYGNEEDIAREAEALKNTIEYFRRKLA
ncbi:MAG: DegT/DnrJ/EryC1/StrS family aminotransferase, partial [Lentisphaeria bacterium]|nr:DegT/DnrJ/EryC1/StrS family aminotransferase [Lentisphaeria bacterium]